MSLDVMLGQKLAEAIAADELEAIHLHLAQAEIIVLQQIDEQTGESVTDEDGEVNVVLAEMDEGIAVVCFTDETYVDRFREVFQDRIPEKCPRVIVTGESLITSMPEECGLLINSGSEHECFLPSGTLDSTEE